MTEPTDERILALRASLAHTTMQRDAMAAALRPFAAYVEGLHTYPLTTEEADGLRIGHAALDSVRRTPTVGDCRCAAAALGGGGQLRGSATLTDLARAHAVLAAIERLADQARAADGGGMVAALEEIAERARQGMS